MYPSKWKEKASMGSMVIRGILSSMGPMFIFVSEPVISWLHYQKYELVIREIL